MQAIDYRITTEFIELNQLLKICGLAASGGAGGARRGEGPVEGHGSGDSTVGSAAGARDAPA